LSRAHGNLEDDRAGGFAVDGAGNVVVVGEAHGNVDFGGGPLVSAGGRDVFAVKLDPNGNHLWSKVFGDAADQYGTGVAVDAAGNVVLTGYFYGAVSFGGAPLANTFAPYSDGFVAKLDPSGNHLWSRKLAGPEQIAPVSLAVDTAGNVVVAGFFNDTADLGGAPLVAAGSFYDAFVGKLDPNGNHLWSKRFGNAAGQTLAFGVATGAGGAVVLSGFFSSAVDFGLGPLYTAGADDVFAAKLDPITGNAVWAKRFGGTGTDWCFGAASNAAGEVVIAGQFQGTVSFGGPAFTASYIDGFVAKYAP
jgi:hypothetical protein